MRHDSNTTLVEAKIAEKPSDCLNAIKRKESSRNGHVSAPKHTATRTQHVFFISKLWFP